jgi:cytochrome P450
MEELESLFEILMDKSLTLSAMRTTSWRRLAMPVIQQPHFPASCGSRYHGDRMYSRSSRARFTRCSTAIFLLQTACLKKSTYLDQVMKETLGLWPPAPITVRVANEVCSNIYYV